MRKLKFNILNSDLLEKFCDVIDLSALDSHFNNLTESELSAGTFSFYTSVAAVYSSKIEGENIELDSFVKHKKFGIEYLPDYTRKIDDLYTAYQFAQVSDLNEENILIAHRLLSKNLLPNNRQGQYRKGNMYVTTPDGKIEYVAASPFVVKEALNKFYSDIESLLKSDLDMIEVFYFASFIHLIFAKIHPFDDGNGRSSRLIEKWFLAKKLGPKAWLIESEKNYYSQHQNYYRNIRLLGLEYDLLDYTQSLPFLMMLPNSLIAKE